MAEIPEGGFYEAPPCKLVVVLMETQHQLTKIRKSAARETPVYGKRHPKTLATEKNMLSRRQAHRRVVERLVLRGSWSYVVAVRRAFVRLLKKP